MGYPASYFRWWKTILRNLDDELEWIAKDENGIVFVYADKPIKKCNKWYSGTCTFYEMIFPELFQWVKWEDKEPCYIPDLLDENWSW